MPKLMLCLTAITALLSVRAALGGRRAIRYRACDCDCSSYLVNLTAEQRFIIKEIVYKDLESAQSSGGSTGINWGSGASRCRSSTT